MMLHRGRCEECQFSIATTEEIQGSTATFTEFRCHKLPPQIVYGERGIWPVVPEDG